MAAASLVLALVLGGFVYLAVAPLLSYWKQQKAERRALASKIRLMRELQRYDQ